jgi:hypothetical protein
VVLARVKVGGEGRWVITRGGSQGKVFPEWVCRLNDTQLGEVEGDGFGVSGEGVGGRGGFSSRFVVFFRFVLTLPCVGQRGASSLKTQHKK